MNKNFLYLPGSSLLWDCYGREQEKETREKNEQARSCRGDSKEIRSDQSLSQKDK
jgi:hypothetical protein